MRDYLITTVIVALIDLIFFIPSSPWVFKVIKETQKESVNLRIFPLSLMYPLLALAIRVLVHPLLTKTDLIRRSMKYGGMLGFTIVGVNQLINLGTMKKWSPLLAFVDILWGGFCIAAASLISFKLLNKVSEISMISEKPTAGISTTKASESNVKFEKY